MQNEVRLIDANTPRKMISKTMTHFARIIVSGSVEKPYYSILWFDPADREYHIGYSSYNLGFVSQWLSENFEIVGDTFLNEPVVHGTWETSQLYDGDGNTVYIHHHRGCNYESRSYKEHGTPYCPNCGARMDAKEET